MPDTQINAKWTTGNLVFYDIATGTVLMTIKKGASDGVDIPILTSASATTSPVVGTAASGIMDATYCVDRFLWTAPWACTVTAIYFQQSAVEASGSSTTVMPKKVPTATAVASGNALLAAAVNLKTGVVVNTTLAPALTATGADLALVAGDSIGLDFTNAITEYKGSCTIAISKT